jgi:threonylcarbamoyladenosine tRNA methylthiotransferase CDKAL1
VSSPRLFVCSAQLGCPVNLAFTTRLHNWIEANGWALEPAATADYLVVVSCSILVEYRRAMVAAVTHLARRYPQQQILVTGCFVPEDVVRAPNVAYIGMDETALFDRRLTPAVPLRDAPSISIPEEDAEVRALAASPAVYDRPYNVLVATGCLSRCHYCLEKNLFPKIQSVPLATVVATCQEGLRKGYRSFLIGGTDVASYGRDLGLDLTDLFAALFSGEAFGGRGDVAIGFKALEPSRFLQHFPRLKPYFQEQRIDWIYLPIESGSDRVLASMNRHYRVDELLRVVGELREVAPRLRIETDFVICYPTEQREDFEASLRLVDRFDHWNLVVFGRHENTAACAMPDEFSPEERARRLEIVAAMVARESRPYRPECRTLIELQQAAPPGPAGLFVLSPRLAHVVL